MAIGKGSPAGQRAVMGAARTMQAGLVTTPLQERAAQDIYLSRDKSHNADRRDSKGSEHPMTPKERFL